MRRLQRRLVGYQRDGFGGRAVGVGRSVDQAGGVLTFDDHRGYDGNGRLALGWDRAGEVGGRGDGLDERGCFGRDLHGGRRRFR